MIIDSKGIMIDHTYQPKLYARIFKLAPLQENSSSNSFVEMQFWIVEQLLDTKSWLDSVLCSYHGLKNSTEATKSNPFDW